jgi:hypothetical protein
MGTVIETATWIMTRRTRRNPRTEREIGTATTETGVTANGTGIVEVVRGIIVVDMTIMTRLRIGRRGIIEIGIVTQMLTPRTARGIGTGITSRPSMVIVTIETTRTIDGKIKIGVATVLRERIGMPRLVKMMRERRGRVARIGSTTSVLRRYGGRVSPSIPP